MKQVLVFTLLISFILACGGGPKDEKVTKSEPAAAPAENKVDGEKVYKQYCVTCHGVYGDMGASGAFDLSKTKLTVDEKVAIITNGRNTMTPFKGLLTEAKIKAVAEYTETLKK